MAIAYKKPKKIKIFLLATILITLGGVIGIYIGFRQDSKISESVPESIEADATLSGSLEANSAHYIKGMNQMVLKDLTVTFFLKDNSEVTLVADQGILETDTNDIEVSGNVIVNNNEYRLLTEKLSYAHKRRVLYSTVPVTISGASTQIAADSISFDLNSKKLTLEGSVEATIAKNFKL
jgi:LPS export ABC transporter protein LptC